jgi:hypothetical protein
MVRKVRSTSWVSIFATYHSSQYRICNSFPALQSKTPSLIMQCATRASDIISHQGTIFLTFSTVATDEVRKEVELAKIRNDQSHPEEHSLSILNFHQNMGLFITK